MKSRNKEYAMTQDDEELGKKECLVSVLMSIYKESVPVVSTAVDSIRQQTYQNLELVVMLDNPAHEEMKGYLEKLRQEEPRLRYYVNAQNMGLLGSLNKGMKLCEGAYICRMDEDDYAERTRIEKQLSYLQQKKLNLVGCYTGLMDMEGKLTGEVRRYPSSPAYVERLLGVMNAVPHPTWLAEKEVFDNLEGYRDIECADDYDFLIRACIYGYRLGVVPEVLLRYRINRKGMTQQNIASQKVVSEYLAKQMRTHTVYPVAEIDRYRRENRNRQEKLVQYYTIGKKWKMGEKLSLGEKMTFLCTGYHVTEIRQRLQYRFILYRDRRHLRHEIE